MTTRRRAVPLRPRHWPFGWVYGGFRSHTFLCHKACKSPYIPPSDTAALVASNATAPKFVVTSASAWPVHIGSNVAFPCYILLNIHKDTHFHPLNLRMP